MGQPLDQQKIKQYFKLLLIRTINFIVSIQEPEPDQADSGESTVPELSGGDNQ